MDELRERVRRELERIEPSTEALGRTLGLVRRRQRNRRLGAGAVGLLLTAGIAIALWTSIDGGRSTLGVSPSPTPSASSAGPRLVLTGDGEAWVVDVDATSARHVVMPELGPGDPLHRVVRRVDVLVAWGSGTPLVLDPDLRVPPRVLGQGLGSQFLPSAVQDRVWVEVRDPEDPDAGVRSIREMTVDGEITVPDAPTPGGMWPVAAVNQGLVFQVSRDDETHLMVWDPRTDTVIDRLQGVFPLAWRGDLLAWCEAECDAAHVTNFATGEELVVPCPTGTIGFDGYEGAFAPDGQTLALSLAFVLGSDPKREIALIDVADGSLSVAPRTVVDFGYVFVDWSASGESVFITGGERFGARQLVEYRPAEDVAREIAVEVGDFYDMAAV